MPPHPSLSSADSPVGVVGLGYVGLPLAVTLAEAGVSVVGLDAAAPVVAGVNDGRSHIDDILDERLARLTGPGLIRATSLWSELSACQAVIICLPTPLNQHREPDLSIVVGAAEALSPHLVAGQLVVLESTTYPGTTRGELRAALERHTSLEFGREVHIAFSPERVDPGRVDFTTKTTPKVVGGLTPACTARAAALYERFCDRVVVVGSPEVAEMTKLLENIFRAVNIALVNELAMLCDRMQVDVWEVIDAAATKPFGFMPFRPGPGLGGHCIPIDPFYLTWKAREFEFHTEFIELAGKVNAQMPEFCVAKIGRALNRQRKPVNGSRVLVLGVAYKPNVADMRESPALRIIHLLREEGADVRFHDPHVVALPALGLPSVPLTDDELASADVVVVVTDHRAVDYAHVLEASSLVVDLRNAVPGTSEKLVRL
ncbi:MAG: nucleotide sugar dehydrogenase [Actinobacteria bacterium]|nr:nucleotide sugar dehydrogenase [Actinomycetota bacterium]